MQIQVTDFNDAAAVLARNHSSMYKKLERALAVLPLQLKASDQKGKQGTPIFDPVGTNAKIKESLASVGFIANHPVPQEFRFLGTDVDYATGGMLVEVQFSNYPFLLNNLLRSELFFNARSPMPDDALDVVVIVTKAHLLPASNSTLYYEQAQNQLTALADNEVFDVPMRLIGLFTPINEPFTICWNEYEDPRYSRTLVASKTKQAIAHQTRTGKSRCTIEFIDS